MEEEQGFTNCTRLSTTQDIQTGTKLGGCNMESHSTQESRDAATDTAMEALCALVDAKLSLYSGATGIVYFVSFFEDGDATKALLCNKHYVGKSAKSWESRLKARWSGCPAINAAGKKYGWENCVVDILWGGAVEMLNEMEIFYIADKRTLSPDGYNLTGGGDGGALSEVSIAKMLEKRLRKRKRQGGHLGVGRRKQGQRWEAQLQVGGGKKRSLGRFDSEECAARVWDKEARDARGADTPANFPDDPATLAALLAAETKKETSSRFEGVSWNKLEQRWKPSIKVGGKQRHLGTFASEECAARVWDKAARAARGPDAPANFADDPAALEALLAAEPEKAKSSRFVGVNWCKTKQRWKAQLRIDGKRRSLGNFTSEESAARVWDKAARELRGPDTPANFADDPLALAAALKAEPKKKTSSRFVGVNWEKRRQRWKAQIRAGGKHRHLGYFVLEEVAARAYKRASELRGDTAIPNKRQPQSTAQGREPARVM